MSRSGYSDECTGWDLIRWRGAVTSALRGARGQAFLLETLAALDALPEAKLITNDLAAEGAFCTLGAVGRARQMDLSQVDPEDHEAVAGIFTIPHTLACEIMFLNDEGSWCETPRARWERMRAWIIANLKNGAPPATRDSLQTALTSECQREPEATEPQHDVVQEPTGGADE